MFEGGHLGLVRGWWGSSCCFREIVARLSRIWYNDLGVMLVYWIESGMSVIVSLLAPVSSEVISRICDVRKIG